MLCCAALTGSIAQVFNATLVQQVVTALGDAPVLARYIDTAPCIEGIFRSRSSFFAAGLVLGCWVCCRTAPDAVAAAPRVCSAVRGAGVANASSRPRAEADGARALSLVQPCERDRKRCKNSVRSGPRQRVYGRAGADGKH
eukprot:130811-Rhodomonas_salina.3